MGSFMPQLELAMPVTARQNEKHRATFDAKGVFKLKTTEREHGTRTNNRTRWRRTKSAGSKGSTRTRRRWWRWAGSKSPEPAKSAQSAWATAARGPLSRHCKQAIVIAASSRTGLVAAFCPRAFPRSASRLQQWWARNYKKKAAGSCSPSASTIQRACYRSLDVFPACGRLDIGFRDVTR